MNTIILDIPNWTEIGGFWLSLASLIAAGIAAWKLLKRDKQRESEVDALVNMSKHYEKMVAIEGRKRRAAIRPEFIMDDDNRDDSKIRLRNVGNNAFYLMVFSSENWKVFWRDKASRVLSEAVIEIDSSGYSETIQTRIDHTYSFMLQFSDFDGNSYTQDLERRIDTNNNEYYTLHPPVLNSMVYDDDEGFGEEGGGSAVAGVRYS